MIESYDGEASDEETDEDLTDVLDQRQTRTPDTGAPVRRNTPPPPPSTGYRYPLPGGTIAELNFAGPPVTAKGLGMLKKYVELLELALAGDESAVADGPQTAAPLPSPTAQSGARSDGLTDEAQELLRKVDAGGVPSFISGNLERVARENGVNVAEGMTPNEIIDGIRRKAD